jgi:hypothetical protein
VRLDDAARFQKSILKFYNPYGLLYLKVIVRPFHSVLTLRLHRTEVKLTV